VVFPPPPQNPSGRKLFGAPNLAALPLRLLFPPSAMVVLPQTEVLILNPYHFNGVVLPCANWTFPVLYIPSLPPRPWSPQTQHCPLVGFAGCALSSLSCRRSAIWPLIPLCPMNGAIHGLRFRAIPTLPPPFPFSSLIPPRPNQLRIRFFSAYPFNFSIRLPGPCELTACSLS